MIYDKIGSAEVYRVFPFAGDRAGKNHSSPREEFIIKNNVPQFVQWGPGRIVVMFNKPADDHGIVAINNFTDKEGKTSVHYFITQAQNYKIKAEVTTKLQNKKLIKSIKKVNQIITDDKILDVCNEMLNQQNLNENVKQCRHLRLCDIILASNLLWVRIKQCYIDTI